MSFQNLKIKTKCQKNHALLFIFPSIPLTLDPSYSWQFEKLWMAKFEMHFFIWSKKWKSKKIRQLYLFLYYTSMTPPTNIDDIAIVWRILFTHRWWLIETIAPTHNALKRCVLGAALQPSCGMIMWRNKTLNHIPIHWV